MAKGLGRFLGSFLFLFLFSLFFLTHCSLPCSQLIEYLQPATVDRIFSDASHFFQKNGCLVV